MVTSPTTVDEVQANQSEAYLF